VVGAPPSFRSLAYHRKHGRIEEMKLAHSSQLKRSSQPTGNGESWNRASPTRTMARCRSNRRPWGSPGISLAIVLLVATMLNLTSGTHASIGVGQEDESNASLRWVGTRPEPLTAAEREAKLQKLIDEFESQNKDKPLLKEEKLFNLLQGWKAMYEREGQAAIQKWYETAKEDVFTIAGHGTTDSAECKDGDSGGEKLGPEKEAALLHSLQIWDAMYESSGKYAVFDWYDLARYNIFDMPKFPSVHYAEYETDPSDLFYLNSRIDSQHGTHYHLMEYFECFADRPNMMVEAYNDETIWRFLRYLYVGVVGPEKSSLRQMDGFGFEVPVRFAYAEGKGRGIYAVEDIPKVRKLAEYWPGPYSYHSLTPAQYFPCFHTCKLHHETPHSQDTVVMNSSLFCAKFHTASDYRRFVASLPAQSCLRRTRVELWAREG
jgi:hypothetical protein